MEYLPYWLYVFFFKLAGNIHYDLIPPFGEKLLPIWIVGLVMGGACIIQIVFDIPIGRIMDRYGYKRFLVLSSVLFTFGAALYLNGLTKATYFWSIAFAEFGWLFFSSGTVAYCLSQARKGNAGRFLSKKDIAGSAGVVACSLVLPFIVAFSPPLVAYILMVLLLCAFIGMVFAPHDKDSAIVEKMPGQHHHVRRHPLKDILSAIRRLNPASGMLAASNFAGATFYGAVWFVVPLVLASQVNKQVMSLGLGVFDLSIIVLGYALGSIADRYNKRKVVFTGLLLFGVAAVLSGFNFDWLFLVFGFLATTGDEMSQLSLWSWLHSLERSHADDGAISGAINFFNDIGWAIGPIIAGAIYLAVGPSWTIVIAAIPIVLVWLSYQFVMRRHPESTIPLRELPQKPHRPRGKG